MRWTGSKPSRTQEFTKRAPDDRNRLGPRHLPTWASSSLPAIQTYCRRGQRSGSLVTLADTLAGYGCVRNLPEGASGFNTVLLKCNDLSTVREGTVVCEASDGRGYPRSGEHLSSGHQRQLYGGLRSIKRRPPGWRHRRATASRVAPCRGGFGLEGRTVSAGQPSCRLASA